MPSFHDLPSTAKTFYLLFVFAMLCAPLCLAGFTHHKKSKITSFLLIFCAVLSAMILVLYIAVARTHRYDYKPVPGLLWYCSHNILISLLPLCFVLAVVIYTAVKENTYRKHLITYSSIRSAIDHLSTGLCFSYENGRVMLVNHLMYTMCFKVVGRDLQNANLFWEILRDGEVLEGVERIDSGDHPSLKLPDGSVWTFSREKISDFYQLTAVETTEYYNLSLELEKNNKELKQLNKRLKKYGEDVDQLTRSNERIETKARIHSHLGQALLASRRYLTEDEIKTIPLDIWHRCITLLSKEAELNAEEDPMDVLYRFVMKAGLDVNITGEFPRDEKVLEVFFTAAAEALTNAVKHANAKKMFVDLLETDTHCTVSFRNDGESPRTAVREGGGLNSLRRKVESAGGTMSIDYKQGFVLTITMKKGGTESDQRINS